MYIQRKRHYKCSIPEIKAEDYHHDSSITLQNGIRLETEIAFNSKGQQEIEKILSEHDKESNTF